jgi:hypothetical protein
VPDADAIALHEDPDDIEPIRLLGAPVTIDPDLG